MLISKENELVFSVAALKRTTEVSKVAYVLIDNHQYCLGIHLNPTDMVGVVISVPEGVIVEGTVEFQGFKAPIYMYHHEGTDLFGIICYMHISHLITEIASMQFVLHFVLPPNFRHLALIEQQAPDAAQLSAMNIKWKIPIDKLRQQVTILSPKIPLMNHKPIEYWLSYSPSAVIRPDGQVESILSVNFTYPDRFPLSQEQKVEYESLKQELNRYNKNAYLYVNMPHYLERTDLTHISYDVSIQLPAPKKEETAEERVGEISACDTVVCARGQKVRLAHSSVLGLRSPRILSIFQNEAPDERRGGVVLDFKFSAGFMGKMVDYCYSGRLAPLAGSEIAEWLEFTIIFEMKQFNEHIASQWWNFIDQDNVFRLLDLALLCSCDTAANYCELYLASCNPPLDNSPQYFWLPAAVSQRINMKRVYCDLYGYRMPERRELEQVYM